MVRIWMTAVTLVLLASTAQAQLKIEKVHGAYGPLGPERPSHDYCLQDRFVIRWLTTGLTLDSEGMIDSELTWKFTAPDGKVVFTQSIPQKGKIFLGGGGGPGSVQGMLDDPTLVPGDYQVELTVKDNLTSKEATAFYPVHVKPVEFALTRAGFSYDAEGAVPAPAGGVVGQSLCFRARVLGFSVDEGHIHLEHSMQVLDAKGRPQMPQPLHGSVKRYSPLLESHDDSHIDIAFPVRFNRAGDFTLCVTAEDKIANKTVQLRIPLHVSEQ